MGMYARFSERHIYKTERIVSFNVFSLVFVARSNSCPDEICRAQVGTGSTDVNDVSNDIQEYIIA